MLYFSKLKIISVLIFTIVISFFTISNFIKLDNELFKRNINLGLDLQGGSYLLLEIDNSPVITQKLQNAIPTYKKFFKEKKINLRNFKIIDDKFLIFEANENKIDKVKEILENKEDGFVLVGNSDILSNICRGIFFELSNQGFCMVGKKK